MVAVWGGFGPDHTVSSPHRDVILLTYLLITYLQRRRVPHVPKSQWQINSALTLLQGSTAAYIPKTELPARQGHG